MKPQNFEQHYRGTLRGILKEEQYLKLAEEVQKHPCPWYGVSFHDELLQAVELSAQEAGEKLLQLREEIVQKNYISRSYPYTYFTVAEKPTFIKLYHPGECGGSCSTSAPDPWWVLSSIKPSAEELSRLRPKPAKSFFSRFKKS